MQTRPAGTRRSAGERRQQLLDAAVEVMSEHGIAGTSTRAITDAAGVPQGIFHYCFESKGALLRALLERESHTAMAAVWQLDPGSMTFEQALSTAVEAQLARVRAEPRQFLVLAELNILARTDAELLEISQRDQMSNLDLIVQHLSRWPTNQTAEQLRRWATVILAGIDGLTESWLTMRDDDATSIAAALLARAVSSALVPGVEI